MKYHDIHTNHVELGDIKGPIRRKKKMSDTIATLYTLIILAALFILSFEYSGMADKLINSI